MKAKVFVSCGQRSHETSCADEVFNTLTKLGFDCYVAISDQSLSGLRENIFHQLETSEYFLFIDFQRDRFFEKADNGDPLFRGSLFVNQELAIASYLQKDCIMLQQKGVLPLDGILSCVQANVVPFDRHSEIPCLLERLVKERGWTAGWKSKLVLESIGTNYQDAWIAPNEEVRFFHVEVRNLHRTKIATQCCVFLKAIRDLGGNRDVHLQTIEYKWAGTPLPYVLIGPSAYRKFDAVKIWHSQPWRFGFNVHTDSDHFLPQLPDRGEFDLLFCVHSENFPPAERMFHLTLGGDLASSNFTVRGS